VAGNYINVDDHDEEYSLSYSVIEYEPSERLGNLTGNSSDSFEFDLFNFAGNATPSETRANLYDQMPIIDLAYMSGAFHDSQKFNTPSQTDEYSFVGEEEHSFSSFEDCARIKSKTKHELSLIHKKDPAHARHSRSQEDQKISNSLSRDDPFGRKVIQITKEEKLVDGTIPHENDLKGLPLHLWTKHVFAFLTPKEVSVFSKTSSKCHFAVKKLTMFNKNNLRELNFQRRRPKGLQQLKGQLKQFHANKKKYDICTQVCVLGLEQCGKTSFVTRYGKNKFRAKRRRKLRTSLKSHSRDIHVNDLALRLTVWDTPSFNSRRIRRFRELFKKVNFQSIFLCFDLANEHAFKEWKKFLPLLKTLLDFENQDIFIVGFKTDLGFFGQNRAQIREISKELKRPVFYCSSKNGEGFCELIKTCAESAVSKGFFTRATDKNKNCSIM